MGCGGSKTLVVNSRREPEGASRPYESDPVLGEHKSKLIDNMEDNDYYQYDQDEEDEENEKDEPIDITRPIAKGTSREKIDLLEVSDFLAEGGIAIKRVNEMPMNIEDIPENFQKSRTLRLIYYNSRYVVGRGFCKKLLDELVDQGIISCIANALKRLQDTWPNVFIETPKKKFNANVESVDLSKYNPPEKAALQVWIKLSSTAVGVTDLHEGCRTKAGLEGLIEYYLKDFLPAVISRPYLGHETAQGTMIQSCINVLYHCSMSSANLVYFQKSNGVEKLMKLSKTPNERLNMSVLFALSYLIEEKDNHLIMANNETIDKIIDFLKNACKTESRSYKGLSCLELANALERVAVNDANKKMIGSRNGLEALVQMLNVAKYREQRIAAANAIWMLLFDEENKQRLMNMDGSFDSIMAHKDSKCKELQKAVTGIMWEVKMKHKHMKEFVDSTQDVSDNNNNDSVKHVMISYNWGQQQTMLKLRDALKEAGYNVWMDVDNIGGSTLQAMASAVENSAVILVGVSRRYKDSPNCRSEAEYAFQLRKTIVPLMLEKNYQPDGWLGFIVGAKLWIDFASQNNFRDSVTKLIREVGERGRGGDEVIKPVDEVDLGALPEKEKTSRTKEISKWGQTEVRNWIAEKCELERPIDETILKRLTGKRLLYLYQLHQEAPDFFFQTLRADFGFYDVVDLLEFWNALKALLSV